MTFAQSTAQRLLEALGTGLSLEAAIDRTCQDRNLPLQSALLSLRVQQTQASSDQLEGLDEEEYMLWAMLRFGIEHGQEVGSDLERLMAGEYQGRHTEASGPVALSPIIRVDQAPAQRQQLAEALASAGWYGTDSEDPWILQQQDAGSAHGFSERMLEAQWLCERYGAQAQPF